MSRILSLVGAGALLYSIIGGTPIDAATAFASPAFQMQWQTGEAIAPNFWGPLATAKDGQQEPYKEAAGGNRPVQYFDKGRMELTNGAVTNGLLATEIIKGQLQTGDSTFQQQAPPAIPIAGDPDNPGPTYAQLGSKGKGLFDAAPRQVGNAAQAVVAPTGDISVSNTGATPATTFAAYDDVTRHNVPKSFADYRTKAGLATIGYALCEPFAATVKVAGQQRQVLVQVFERRVLTYTASNAPAFQVEMGNIGQHYYQWRYGTPTAPTAVTTATSSANWSGYAAQTKNITAVHAAWIVPAVVAPPTTGYAATWVGIGGVTTQDLIQAGTEQDIEDGVPTYYAWVEALPDDTLGVSSRRLPAHPGDVFSVTITNTTGSDWSLVLENRTTGQRLSLTVTYQSCTCAAEWVEELPDIEGISDPAVANFDAVRFIEATATVGGVVKNAADLYPEPLALKQHGKLVAQPQPIGADGASFAVTYMR